MVDKLQTEPANANEIYDIEPLMVPGVDWQFWLESFAWGLTGLLVLVAVLYLGSRWYRPLVFKWQLKALSKSLSGSQQSISKPQVWQLYSWLKQLNQWLDASQKPLTIAFQSDLSKLMQLVNQAGFSEQTVSRETYLDLIQQAEQLLKQLPVLPSVKTRINKNQTEEARWKR